ncbi:MAG TPA: hypothetical protein VNT52_03990 [Acidimicrobiales bacterium]|nr:hypothetical protein [Acidimicrobiales bacterium]
MADEEGDGAGAAGGPPGLAGDALEKGAASYGRRRPTTRCPRPPGAGTGPGGSAPCAGWQRGGG